MFSKFERCLTESHFSNLPALLGTAKRQIGNMKVFSCLQIYKGDSCISHHFSNTTAVVSWLLLSPDRGVSCSQLTSAYSLLYLTTYAGAIVVNCWVTYWVVVVHSFVARTQPSVCTQNLPSCRGHWIWTCWGWMLQRRGPGQEKSRSLGNGNYPVEVWWGSQDVVLVFLFIWKLFLISLLVLQICISFQDIIHE